METTTTTKGTDARFRQARQRAMAQAIADGRDPNFRTEGPLAEMLVERGFTAAQMEMARDYWRRIFTEATPPGSLISIAQEQALHANFDIQIAKMGG
jgi:hypothetical protein